MRVPWRKLKLSLAIDYQLEISEAIFFKEACRVVTHIALEAEIPPCRTQYEFLSAFRELVCKAHLS